MPEIPMRTSSRRKRDIDAAALDELNKSRLKVADNVAKARKELKLKASLDSEYWTRSSELCKLEREWHEMNAKFQFKLYCQAGGNLSFSQWQHEAEDGQKAVHAMSSLNTLREISSRQAERLDPKRPRQGLEIPRRMRASFTKLFNTSRLGFGLRNLGQGARKSSEQSQMRTAMIDAYGCDELAIWEPVMGCHVTHEGIHAAHLFPYRSASLMDTIFGEGALDELFSPLNGLFLQTKVEAALENGTIAFIPNIDLDVNEMGTHPVFDNTRLALWRSQTVKDYKVWVLDKGSQKAHSKIFSLKCGYPVETIAQLHNRKLVFQTDFRPRARYMWWAFLNSVQQFSMRQPSNQLGTRKEVLNSTRYWGTQGRYIHENFLLGFIEELGNVVDPETASIIMGNAKEDPSTDREADPVAVTIMATEGLMRVKERRGEYSESESDSESEGEGDGGSESEGDGESDGESE